MKIKLVNPIHVDDKTISDLELNLAALKGKDIIQIEREARVGGDVSPNPLFSSAGLAIAAAKTSGLKKEEIEDLSAPDFVQVTTAVSNFLYGWVLPSTTTAPSESSENLS